MLIQGYVSVRVGVLKSRAFNDLGIAGVAGAILAVPAPRGDSSAALILTALVYISKNWKKAYEQEENRCSPVIPRMHSQGSEGDHGERAMIDQRGEAAWGPPLPASG